MTGAKRQGSHVYNSQTSLRWLKGSEYHTVTECKRFAVARVSVLGRIRFEAYRTPTNAPAFQIASRQLGPTPTREERDEAIDALKAECEGWTP